MESLILVYLKCTALHKSDHGAEVQSIAQLYRSNTGARQQVLKSHSGKTTLWKAALPPTQSLALRAGRRSYLESSVSADPRFSIPPISRLWRMLET